MAYSNQLGRAEAIPVSMGSWLVIRAGREGQDEESRTEGRIPSGGPRSGEALKKTYIC